jgi:23S rRNA pseudouridine1911/1915/1917 synthase
MAPPILPGLPDVEPLARSTRAAPARERFDPPVLRARWTIEVACSGDAFAASLAERTGWDGETVGRLLRHGGVHLDGRPHARADLPARLAAGTHVDLHALTREPEPVALGAERVLAERDDWLALDKPAHVAVQATRASRLAALEPALRAARGEPGWVAVHRLDRETSGVVVFARDARAAARLGAAFSERRARKRYLALVAPPPARDAFTVTGWIARTLHPTRYRYTLRAAAAPGHRASETRFRVRARAGDRALLEAEPLTGRTHQIRVHCEAERCPVVGDTRYGGVAASRVQLHAAELAFEDRGEALVLRAPLPEDLEPEFLALGRRP